MANRAGRWELASPVYFIAFRYQLGKEDDSMNWFADMNLLIIFSLAPIIASIVLGAYWLKHERFPWEK